MRIDVSPIRDERGASMEVSVREAIGRTSAGAREVVPMGPVEVTVRATNTGQGKVLVQARGVAKLQAACDRCLGSCAIDAAFGFEQQYRRSPREDGPERQRAQDGDYEGDDRVYSGDSVDISDQVRDSLALCLPIKVLCSEDCRGLCPRCGRNLNDGPCGCPDETKDARLAVLLDMVRPEDARR